MKTEKLLNQLGFKVESLGYQYWLYAIRISKSEYWKYSYSMEIVYHDIARNYNTTRDRVERCMRQCLPKSKELIANYFNYSGKLTTKSILQLLIRDFKKGE